MTCRKLKLVCFCLLIFMFCSTGFGGKIIYPWRSTTAIVKAGESFEVWFDASAGQATSSVELQGPYNTVYTAKTIAVGRWRCEFAGFFHSVAAMAQIMDCQKQVLL